MVHRRPPSPGPAWPSASLPCWHSPRKLPAPGSPNVPRAPSPLGFALLCHVLKHPPLILQIQAPGVQEASAVSVWLAPREAPPPAERAVDCQGRLQRGQEPGPVPQGPRPTGGERETRVAEQPGASETLSSAVSSQPRPFQLWPALCKFSFGQNYNSSYHYLWMAGRSRTSWEVKRNND